MCLSPRFRDVMSHFLQGAVEKVDGEQSAECRNINSEICFAAVGPLLNISDTFNAEAPALSNAIKLVDCLGVGRVIFASDCINLKRAMNTTDYDLGPLGLLLSDMKFGLRMSFIDAYVMYAPRGYNKPAYELADLGI